MKLLIADKFPQEYLDVLSGKGHEVHFEPDLNESGIPDRISDFDALVVRSTRVTTDAIDAGTNLRIVIRAGAGTNTIATAHAAERGVSVCNVPGKNAVAVAELAMGLLLSIDRNIPDNVSEIRSGQWNKKRFSVARGVCGLRLGIVGFGAIGQAMAERAHAFGMPIGVVDKPDRSASAIELLQSMDSQSFASSGDLVAWADVISIHVPGGPDTRHLINAEMLEKVRPGAVIINTSRGDVIDPGALIAVMDDRGVRAGLDVYPDEPSFAAGPWESALAKHPNVYGTHHIGASTEQAQNAVAEGVVDIIEAFGRGEVLHCVNNA